MHKKRNTNLLNLMISHMLYVPYEMGPPRPVIPTPKVLTEHDYIRMERAKDKRVRKDAKRLGDYGERVIGKRNHWYNGTRVKSYPYPVNFRAKRAGKVTGQVWSFRDWCAFV